MAVIDWLNPEHKAERAHTRNTAWSRNWQQFACALLYTLPFLQLFFPPTDNQLCCVILSRFPPFLPSCSLSKALSNYHSPITLVPLLCNCIWNGKAGSLTSRGHHSSVAYILVLHLHGHHASKQCHRLFFAKKYEGYLKLSEPYRATIQIINHIQSPYFPLALSINNAFVLEKQYHNNMGYGYRAAAIFITDWFHSKLLSKFLDDHSV